MSESETDESASISNENSWAESEENSDVDADCGVVNVGTILPPYQDEPIIFGENVQEEDVDIDGISLDILRSRFEKRTPLNEWCSCNKCDNILLNGMREHRCCSEVQAAIGKLLFDGSIERIKCITQHEDYQSMTKTVVLMHIGPLLQEDHTSKKQGKEKMGV